MSKISNSISRRDMLAVAAAGGALSAATVAQAQTTPAMPQPTVPAKAAPIRARVSGPRQPESGHPLAAGHRPRHAAEFALFVRRLAHAPGVGRLDPAGDGARARHSKNIAGVNMRLNSGGVRELHWHKAAEWSYMLYGTARITAIDAEGRNFVDDVGVGDLWYFPPASASIQGLGPDGCEFLLVFDDGDFDEDNTSLLSDFIKHTPPEVLAKNFGMEASAFVNVPDPSQLYIFPAPLPGPLEGDKIAGATPVPQSFSHRMLAQTPIKTKSGTVRITDTKVFPVSKTIAAALVEVEPVGMREMHWHPNTDEWQYYIAGQARMGVFAASGQARTFDFFENDVGFVPFAMGHYIENTGNTTLRFLEIFKSDYYADVSFDQWLALTPPELVTAHLHTDPQFIAKLRKDKVPVVPA